MLEPKRWTKHVQYGWRFDASELMAGGELKPPGASKPPPAEPWVDPADEEVYLGEGDFIESDDACGRAKKKSAGEDISE